MGYVTAEDMIQTEMVLYSAAFLHGSSCTAEDIIEKFIPYCVGQRQMEKILTYCA